MSIQKTADGRYFVPGRNGKPGRSPDTLREAQAYDRELDACEACEAAAPDPLHAADYLADVVEAYLRALNDGVLYAEMELRSAVDNYRTTRGVQS